VRADESGIRLPGVQGADQEQASEHEERDDDAAGDKRPSAHIQKTPATTKWFP
jgi:hypothetical protein